MSTPRPPDPPLRDDPAAILVTIAVWLVPVLFALYYATPLLLPGRDLDLAFVLISVLPPASAIGLLAVRRRQPVLVVMLIGILLVLSPGAIGAAFVGQAGLARRQGRTPLVALSGGWLVAAKLLALLVGPYQGGWSQASSFELTLAVAGLAIATMAGWLSGSRAAESRSRADVERARQEAEDARVDRARMAERERIAREMHDVLAHRLSLVAMHSGALAFRDDLGAAATRRTARLIQQNARQSLDELRTVLSTLRGPDSAPEPPQPSLAELPVLLAEAREANAVELTQLIEVSEVPDHLSRQAYRIIQEGLTNARKHAPGAPVSLTLAGAAGAHLELTISNPLADLALPPADPAPGGAGLGLVGVSERAAALGGSCEHQVTEGRFRLKVALPWKGHS